MTTLAPSQLIELAHDIEAVVPSAAFSGIVGDAAHRAQTSKHNSIEDNPVGSWAVTGQHDAAPPGTWSRQYAVAIDISMSRTDQNAVHNAFKGLFYDHTDPRRRYVAAFNGWDGQGSPGRYNLVNDTVAVTDDSHKWHEHVEGFYEYELDPEFARALLSLFKLETKEQYVAGGGIPTPPPPWQPTPLDVDGKLGPKTIARWQQVMGTFTDGVISSPSDLVKAVQRHLNARIPLTGSTKLDVDGYGIRQDGRRYLTVAALQRYLDTPRDGVMSTPVSEVVKAVQRKLNAGTF